MACTTPGRLAYEPPRPLYVLRHWHGIQLIISTLSWYPSRLRSATLPQPQLAHVANQIAAPVADIVARSAADPIARPADALIARPFRHWVSSLICQFLAATRSNDPVTNAARFARPDAGLRVADPCGRVTQSRLVTGPRQMAPRVATHSRDSTVRAASRPILGLAWPDGPRGPPCWPW